MPNPVQRKQCRHIRTSGHRCGSASLRDQTFCFYHQRTRLRPAEPEASRPQDATFNLAPIDDRSSIQYAVFEVLRRIALNQIDCKRAGHLLYGLQIAATVLPREPRPAATPQPNHAPNHDLVAEYETHPELGPLAPEADYIPPTQPNPNPTSALSTEINRVLSSFAQPTRRQIPLPDPTLNPTFYTDPTSHGYPELQPFLDQARQQATLPPPPTLNTTKPPRAAASEISHQSPGTVEALIPEIHRRIAEVVVPEIHQEPTDAPVPEIGRDSSPGINGAE